MKIKVLDSKGNSISEHILAKGISDYKPILSTLTSYVRIFRANQRQGTQSTKTRGEVAGSGAKPWAQKHTGRARAGEKRNPIWRHGGIAHGPKPRSWRLDISEQMKKSVMKSVLSIKANGNSLFALEGLNFDKVSTRNASTFLKNTGFKGKTLLILDKNDSVVVKSFRNLTGVKTTIVTDLNAYEILNSKNVVFQKEALNKIETKYIGNKE